MKTVKKNVPFSVIHYVDLSSDDKSVKTLEVTETIRSKKTAESILTDNNLSQMTVVSFESVVKKMEIPLDVFLQHATIRQDENQN